MEGQFSFVPSSPLISSFKACDITVKFCLFMLLFISNPIVFSWHLDINTASSDSVLVEVLQLTYPSSGIVPFEDYVLLHCSSISWQRCLVVFSHNITDAEESYLLFNSILCSGQEIPECRSKTCRDSLNLFSFLFRKIMLKNMIKICMRVSQFPHRNRC